MITFGEEASHLSEIDNESGFPNCNFSTFLSVIMKSLYMSKYLVVFILFPLLAGWLKLNSENLGRKTILTEQLSRRFPTMIMSLI